MCVPMKLSIHLCLYLPNFTYAFTFPLEGNQTSHSAENKNNLFSSNTENIGFFAPRKLQI